MRDALNRLQDAIDARQHNRLMRLSFPYNDGPAAPLLVNRMDAFEALSRPFDITLELLSDNAHIELKTLQGRMLCVELVREDGTLRHFTGRVFSFRLVKVDGGFAWYEARLGPWLNYLALRKDNYLFHDATLYDQTRSIMRDYGVLADWDWRVRRPDLPMTDACQFDETDANYLARRWCAAGLVYWFEHDARGHRLIVGDDTTVARPVDGGPDIPWQRHAGAVEADGIGDWSPVRRMVPASVALGSYDFKQARPVLATMPTLNRQGVVPSIESYEYLGAYGFRDTVDGDARARLRMEEIEAQAKLFEGRGNNRRVMAGRWFRLTGHFDRGGGAGANEFLVVECSHHAANNYGLDDAAPHYDNRLSCLRRTIPWRPGRGFYCDETRIYGIQSATIVGPAGEEIHTDAYGRVRVQFHWDREGSRDERSSAWIRVATPSSGLGFGMSAIPRIGTEVIVAFMGGDPDRPIVTGMIPNAKTLPPWSLPANKTQSGLRSRSTPGGGPDNANLLRFEDRKGAEQFSIQAERDFDALVKHDESYSVLHDASRFVGNDDTRRIGRALFETVRGAALQQVGADKDTLVGRHYRIEAGDSVEITCGQSKLYMDKAGNIALSGASINISAEGALQINGKPVDLNPAGGGPAVTPTPKGGGAIVADVEAQFGAGQS